MAKTATAWVLVSAKRRSYGSVGGVFPVGSVNITKVTKTKPEAGVDQEAVEISIEFPDDYFDSNSPKVHIVVPHSPAPNPAPVTAAVVRGKAPSAAASVIHHA